MFFQTIYYQPSRALFISCNKLHATIHDQPTHGTKQSVVIFPCIFSDNVLSTITNVIHFECSVQLVARTNQPRYAIHDSLVACNLLHERFNLGACLTISTIYDFVQQVARYDLRPNHTRNEIKRGDFSVCFFKQHIINYQERYSFRM